MRDKKSLILIVDDDQNFHEIMGAKFESAGLVVSHASSEEEALKKAEAETPDLILMDINMPGATGTDAALVLKQNAKTKNLRIAFLTSMQKPWPGIASAENETIARDLGMEDFIEKTDDLDSILSQAKALLPRA